MMDLDQNGHEQGFVEGPRGGSHLIGEFLDLHRWSEREKMINLGKG